MKTLLRCAVVAAMLAELVGCGSGGTDAVSPTGGRGALVCQVEWPEVTSRLLPQASASVVVVVTAADGNEYRTQPNVISRPATTARLDGVPQGNATLQALAYPNLDGSGVAQAKANASIVVVPDQTVDVTLTLATTIATLAVTPETASLLTGATQAFEATARDATGGKVALLPTNALRWSVTPGSGVLELNSTTGAAVAVGPGTATVTALELESGIAGTAAVTVSAPTTSGIRAARTTGVGLVWDGTVADSEWAGATRHDLVFRNMAGTRSRPYTVFAAHDGNWLLLGVRTPTTSRWDSYLTVLLDGDNDGQFVGSATFPRRDLIVGKPGPVGWGGYNYYNWGHSGQAVAPPEGTQKACAVVDGILHYEFRLSLADLGATPGQAMAIMFGCGEDGSGSNKDLYPVNADGAQAGTWAPIQLEAGGDVGFTFGGLGTADGQFSGAIWLDAGPNDEIYACDARLTTPRIQVFNSNGQFLRKWDGSEPGGGGALYSLMGLDVYGTTPETAEVYVVNGGTAEVRVFTTTGVFLRKFGGPSELFVPYDVAVSPDGQRVYVADSGNYRMRAYTPTGEILFTWGSRGGANGQFGRSETVQVDSDGNVYVSDGQLHGQNNHRIQKFDANGNWLATFGGPATLNEPMGIAIWGDFLHVADFRNHQMEEIHRTSGATARIWAQGPGSGLGQVDKPFDVTVDSRGNLYVGESYEFGTGNARIQKFVGLN